VDDDQPISAGRRRWGDLAVGVKSAGGVQLDQEMFAALGTFGFTDGGIGAAPSFQPGEGALVSALRRPNGDGGRRQSVEMVPDIKVPLRVLTEAAVHETFEGTGRSTTLEPDTVIEAFEARQLRKSRHSRNSDAGSEASGGAEAEMPVSRANCQFSGKGDFKPVWIELQAAGFLNIRREEGGSPSHALSTRGCTVGSPKSSRKGHPHAFRLDLHVSKNERGVESKFIFSVASDIGMLQWVDALTLHSRMAASKQGVR
jgi:hypothetical protein